MRLRAVHAGTVIPCVRAHAIDLEDFWRSFDERSKTVVYCKASLITTKPSKVRCSGEEMPVKAVQKKMSENPDFLTSLQKLCHNTRLS